ncbi:calcium-binding protein [Leisingera methylohalidivorans]|nr:calcium-binding protein [Leisingera methylohalidivorans]
MARVNLYAATDFLQTGASFYGSVTAATSSLIRIEDSAGNRNDWMGVFYYDSLGYLAGGTVTGFRSYTNYTLTADVSGLSIPALTAAAAVTAGDFGTLYSLGLSGNDFVAGSSESDRLIGFNGDDELNGNGGNDTISGNSGNDTLRGHSGKDTLNGDVGDDLLEGGGAADRLNGGAGSDNLQGNGGNDRLKGGTGKDALVGGAGKDVLDGAGGNDRMSGGNGNDRLNGGAGKDKLNGAGGNDRMTGGGGDDTFIMSRGHDTVTDFDAFSAGERIDLRGVSSITDFEDLMNNHVSRINGDVIIDDLNGNTLTLDSTTLKSLGGDDFIF